MSTKTAIIEKPSIQIDDDDNNLFSAKVILFNDEEHSFDEVIFQLIKAIKCSEEKAYLLTNQVHRSGQAVVYTNDYNRCIKVSHILEEIGLRTQIDI